MNLSIQRTHFFNAIYVVQFLRHDDDTTGHALFEDVLSRIAPSAGIHTAFYDAHNKEEFLNCLQQIKEDCVRHERGPILHLETHGLPSGIGTVPSDSHRWVTWAEIKPLLVALNIVAKGQLLVTMAACHGVHLVRALDPLDRTPVWGLIGPDGQVLPSDVARCFRAFFETLVRDLDLTTALAALRDADESWPATWKLQNAELFFAYVYGHYLHTQGAPEALKRRDEQLVSMLRKRGVRGLDLEAALAFYRTKRSNETAFFERFKHHFLLLDLFPENASLYPITLAGVQQLYAQILGMGLGADGDL